MVALEFLHKAIDLYNEMGYHKNINPRVTDITLKLSKQLLKCKK